MIHIGPSTLIKRKILLSKKIKYLHNNSSNKSDITNYTGKNKSLPNLDSNPNITNSKLNIYSPDKVSPRYKIKEELIKNANNILTQRISHKSPSQILSYGLKRNIINNSKDVSLKNYMINLIKKKRIEINNRELLIKDSNKKF